MLKASYRLIPWFTLVFFLTITVLVWHNERSQYEVRLQQSFNALADKVATVISSRMETYIDAHYSGVGFFTGSNYVDRKEWRAYVDSLNLIDRYPGINGLGYAVQIEHADKEAFEAELREKEWPDYAIIPPGERKNYFVIKYIEPIEINGPALGFDMGSEITRRRAMEAARDTGKARISGKVILVQDANKTPGFLSYVPFYEGGGVPPTVEERREKFRGLVYAPFIMQDFMRGLLRNELEDLSQLLSVDIYSGDEGPDAMLYLDKIQEYSGAQLTLSSAKVLSLYGQNWFLDLIPKPTFFEFAEKDVSNYFLFSGIAISFATFGLLLAITKTRAQALKLAQRMTVDLEKAKQRAEEATRIKSDFLANMSHEIRTPMNGVIAMADMLYETELSPTQKKYTDIIKTSGRNLLEIINEILDFSKIEAGKINLSIQPFDLHHCLEDHASLMQPLAQEKSLEFTLKYDETLPQFMIGDETRLRQVFTNLVGNAIKFTHSGKVQFDALYSDDELHFIVTDTGVGIPQEKQESIFRAFEQVSGFATKTVNGTGLGLSITKSLIEMMGGNIDVKSVMDQGSVFTVRIPFKPVSEEAIEEIAKKQSAEAEFETLSAQILVVEDVTTNQFVVREMLKSLECEIDIAENGAEAVEMVQQKTYDLVLMDCQMPVMNGFDATIKIREMGMKDLPIIALTANAMPEDKQKCIAAGMNDFVSKPVRKKDLHVAMQKWLNKDAKEASS